MVRNLYFSVSELKQVFSFVVTFALHQLSASQLITQRLWIVAKDILKLSELEIYISLPHSW